MPRTATDSEPIHVLTDMWPARFDPSGDIGPGMPCIRAGDVNIVTEHIDRIARKIKIFSEHIINSLLSLNVCVVMG